MKTHIDTQNEYLIDLGAIAVETKGQQSGLVNDGGIQPNNKFTPPSQLSAD